MVHAAIASRAAGEGQRRGRVGLAPAERGEGDLGPGSERIAPRHLAHRAGEPAHLGTVLAEILFLPEGDHASIPKAPASRSQAAPAPAASQPGPASRSRRGAITRAPAARARAAPCSAPPASGNESTANAPPACKPKRWRSPWEDQERRLAQRASTDRKSTR